MDGAAGPSGMDVSSWKMCSSFGRESEDSIASFAKKLYARYVDPIGIEALMTSRLIALDKDPSVHPIGIGDECCRLISKTVMNVIRQDILDVTGCQQLCAGQKSSCEAIVHCVRELHQSGEVDGVLCVDASNAFNALNSGLALHNILHLCLSFWRLLINMYIYKSDVSMFIDGDCKLSKEGTTQGDPLAISMFAVASFPLIKQLDELSDVTQLWYADDATAVGEFQELRRWWDNINTIGKFYGYYANEKKTFLLVKEESYERACECFQGT